MRKNIKTIIAIALCVIGVLWLIPTIFDKSTYLTITSFELAEEKHTTDVYEIHFTYPKGDTVGEGSYKESYVEDWAPAVGGQEVCHYYTCPPFSVHRGDPPSPVPPLCLIAVGLILPYLKKPKFLKKQQKEDSTHE